MKGQAIAMTVALLAVGVTGVPLSGLAQSGDLAGTGADVLQTLDAKDANESEVAPPGARLAGVLGAQEAEVRGEVDSRAFSAAVERAGPDEARARVVDRQIGELEGRLDDLEERKRDLRRAHREGNITTATYVAELTELTARSESTRGLANQSHAAARGLPPDVAERQGINVTAVGALERRAANLTGPEAARIARSIAGPDTGRPVGAGPPDHAGPPDNRSTGPPDDRSAGPVTDRSAGPSNDRNAAANRSIGASDTTDAVAHTGGMGAVAAPAGNATSDPPDRP